MRKKLNYIEVLELIQEKEDEISSDSDYRKMIDNQIKTEAEIRDNKRTIMIYYIVLAIVNLVMFFLTKDISFSRFGLFFCGETYVINIIFSIKNLILEKKSKQYNGQIKGNKLAVEYLEKTRDRLLKLDEEKEYDSLIVTREIDENILAYKTIGKHCDDIRKSYKNGKLMKYLERFDDDILKDRIITIMEMTSLNKKIVVTPSKLERAIATSKKTDYTSIAPVKHSIGKYNPKKKGKIRQFIL